MAKKKTPRLSFDRDPTRGIPAIDKRRDRRSVPIDIHARPKSPSKPARGR
jgi:hypothetical protein